MLFICTRAVLTVLLAIAIPVSAHAASLLEEAAALEQQGRLKEARAMYHTAAEKFRAAGDQPSLATALSSAGNVSISLGDYAAAIADVEEAVKLRQALHENAELGTDFNRIGLAYQYLGDYPAALQQYQKARKSDHEQGNAAGEVGKLNNIGNIYYYFQSRYMLALESYQNALNIVNANASQPWYSWGKKITAGNMAALYQRLGLEQKALELYQQTAGRPEEMAPEEYAQLLLNQGILYRHLGDPIKALEVYRSAQAVFRTARHADGEIAALRNIGIADAADLGDFPGALKAFHAALDLSQRSSNARGIAQANLYLGDVLRRLGQYKKATAHLTSAISAAQSAGLLEDQWKAVYSLGQIAEKTGNTQAALDDYQKAVAIIESVRAGLRVPLRVDFLADKRDVYDSVIALKLRQAAPSINELLQWMERGRARTLLDRMAARSPLSESSLTSVQSHLTPDTVLLEFWVGNPDAFALWITADQAGIVKLPLADSLRSASENLLRSVQLPGDEWRRHARETGSAILPGLPLRRHVIVVPDGPLNFPFEVLFVPGSDRLLIEQADVSYLPSTRFLTTSAASRRRWLFPWNREVIAFADPPVIAKDALAEEEAWQPLPASADEARGIAAVVPGRAELHLGADARKSYLADSHLEGLPLLHLSTHALVDPEHPERSRILLASASSGLADYLFQEEVNNLDLRNVGLVTISACDTARGKMVRGEGIQAFSQSFLAAGASATITSMWKVADVPTSAFMQQLYHSLGSGMTKAEALRDAKLRFLHSHSDLSNPRYWAAFVLYGDGWQSTVPVISWSAVLVASALIIGATGFVLWRVMAVRVAKTARSMASLSR